MLCSDCRRTTLSLVRKSDARSAIEVLIRCRYIFWGVAGNSACRVQRGLKTALAAKRIDEEMYRARLNPVAEPMLLEAARTGHLEDAKRLAELGTNMMCEDSDG